MSGEQPSLSTDSNPFHTMGSQQDECLSGGSHPEGWERSGMNVMLIAADPSERTSVFGGPRFLPQGKTTALKGNPPDRRAAIWLGIIRIVIGAVVVAIQIGSSVVHHSDKYDMVDSTGAGIWCGITFIFAGIMSIVAAIEQKKSLVIAHLVAATISAIFALVLAALCSAASFYLVHYILMSVAVLELMVDLVAAGSTIWLLHKWKTKGGGATIRI